MSIIVNKYLPLIKIVFSLRKLRIFSVLFQIILLYKRERASHIT